MPAIRMASLLRSVRMKREGCLVVPIGVMDRASKQVVNEVASLLRRWSEESDLDDTQLIKCVTKGVDKYFDDDVVDFSSDIDLDE